MVDDNVMHPDGQIPFLKCTNLIFIAALQDQCEFISIVSMLWDFDDWMYLIDDKRLINCAKMKKWGIEVGEVLLWIEKT